jgi:hypothetical protein
MNRQGRQEKPQNAIWGDLINVLPVIPAKAGQKHGVHYARRASEASNPGISEAWIPAFAGMTN